jgi:hypothetical protein
VPGAHPAAHPSPLLITPEEHPLQSSSPHRTPPPLPRLLTHRCFFTFYAFGYLQVVHFPDFYLFEHGQVSHDLSFKSTYGTYDVTTIGLIFLPTFFMAVVLGMALRILKRMDKGGRESNGAGMSRMQPASLASTDSASSVEMRRA